MDFNAIFDQLKSDVVELAKLTLKNYSTEAKEDALLFLEGSKDKLKKWTELLADGKLSISEFEWLVQSQKDLAHMELLYQKGLAKIRVDQFRNSLINLVVDSVLNLVPIP
jgi:hypothetical protein